MSITPEDVRLKLFRARLRGYDMKEVDDFIDGLAAELERLHAHIGELEARLSDRRD